jgi:integrase
MSDNLKKRCDCAIRSWTKCAHPWHFSFKHRGHDFRYSLHKIADKPADYVMAKSEAAGLADQLRGEIRSGKRTIGQPATPTAGLTLGDVADHYIKGHVNRPERRETAAAEMGRQITQLRASLVPGPGGSLVRLDTKPIDAIVKADVEAIRDGRRDALKASHAALAEVDALKAAHITAHTDGEPEIPHALIVAARLARATPKAGEVGTNRLLTRLQHLFVWAIGEGYVNDTPFKRHGVAVVKLNQSAERARARRFVGDEETRLLAAAGPHLQALILAALETGCRRGELLTLQWGQVDLEAGTVFLPAAKTKTAEDRTIPITARLRAVLDMRQTEHASLLNVDRPADAEPVQVPGLFYVFGNEVGEKQDSIKTAWRLTCQRAGITDLHFHDLRRECGSRLIETPGISLVDVRDWLGHKTVDMTNTYLSTTVEKLREAGRKVDKARQQAAGAKKRAESGKKRTSGAHRAKNGPIRVSDSMSGNVSNVLN